MAVVDVIVPSYNHRNFLGKMIESVLENSKTVPLHMWIIDDGSTDGSVEYLQSLNDDRITVAVNEHNMGTSYTSNRGASMGNAPFIAHICSDDVWRPNKLQEQLSAVEHEPEKVCFSLVDYIDENDDPLPEGYGPYNNNTFQCHSDWNRYDWLRLLSKGGNQLNATTFLGRRNILERAGSFDLRMRQVNDIDMWTRVFQLADPLVLPEKLASYRLMSDSSNISGRSKQNSSRLAVESLLLVRKFHKNVPDDVFQKMYSHMIMKAGKFPFDTKIKVMMATNVQRLQLVALEMLAENLETKRDCSALTHKDYHEFSSQLNR